MRLAYLYSRYPVLSQTFCDTEMLELERRGFGLVIASMYPPKTPVRHEYLTRFHAPVHYAPEKRVLDKLVKQAKRKGRWPEALIAQHEQNYGSDYKAALRARNALFFVDLFEREGIRQFHVHFANRAAHTALFVKAVSGIPFSMTAHGQDFMTDLGNAELLQEICAAAEFVAAETDYSRDVLRAGCPASAQKIFRVYNGIELNKFDASPPAARAPGAIRLLSVGRLVEFKGFDVLIDACAELRRADLDFSCEIIGDGPLREELERRIAANNLGAFVRLSGEQPQSYVLAALAACDIFALAALVDGRGASDVFPTVIAEAMSGGKPVVSTTVAGIPELVRQNESGLLVRPRDPHLLAAALKQLIGDEKLREELGRAGRARVERHFAIEQTIEPLLQLLGFGNTTAASSR
ncbi:MAG: glycosyltransferase [Chthoniobacterales bacterium]|nr:glycosyltransferase [Chthoniobacterales bacterium]